MLVHHHDPEIDAGGFLAVIFGQGVSGNAEGVVLSAVSLNRSSSRKTYRQFVDSMKTSSGGGDRMPPLTPSAALRLPLIERWLEAVQPESVIEAGCGMGSMACRLAESFDYRGYEPDLESFQAAERRLAAIGRGEVVNGVLPERPDRQFDLLVAFEVLEHVEDDRTVLRGWCDWVKPGGHVMLSVPAHPDRFGPSDELVGHFRRYSRSSVTEVMREAGLSDIRIEAWGMPAGYGLEWVRNARARRRPDSEDVGTAGSGRLHQPDHRLGAVVQMLSRPISALQMPFRGTNLGIGFIAVGRVPDGV